MAPLVKVSIVGTKQLQRALKKLNPAVNQQIIRKSLIDSALLMQADVAKNQIAHGRGKDAEPLDDQLTSRRGGAGLVGSIGINHSPLPFAIEVGTHLDYGAIHEQGLGGYLKRPFLQPALEKIGPKLPAIFVKHWKREARL